MSACVQRGSPVNARVARVCSLGLVTAVVERALVCGSGFAASPESLEMVGSGRVVVREHGQQASRKGVDACCSVRRATPIRARNVKQLPALLAASRPQAGQPGAGRPVGCLMES